MIVRNLAGILEINTTDNISDLIQNSEPNHSFVNYLIINDFPLLMFIF